MKERILLLGSGGREHAFAEKISRSPRCEQLFIAPGNAGTATCGHNVALSPLDFEAVGHFVLQQSITMVLVGPEEPLVHGIWDYFQATDALRHIPVIGPSKAGAVLEGSKGWAKQFMQRHRIPTAAYQTFESAQLEAAVEYVTSHTLPVVLKADGLAAGKGVVICTTHAEAEVELRAMLGGKFGSAGARVVVEQFLTGIECSVFVLTDGKNYKILPEAKDYKRVGEGDTGPNTGGMGAVSPVPFMDAALRQAIVNRIVRPTVAGLRQEGIAYCGFIFVGLMISGGVPYVIEYNCRMGDPETEVVLPRLRNDLVALLRACADGRLSRSRIVADARSAATIMLVSGGYPGDYVKGKIISGVDQVQGSLVLHAGTTLDAEGRLVTNGGRVLAITSFGADHRSAVQQSLANAEIIQFEGRYFRRDIGSDL